MVAVVALAMAPAAAGMPKGTEAATAQTSFAFRATIRDGRAAARELLRAKGAPSLSLALVSDGRVVWREGFGDADRATGAAPGRDTMYGLASVSKLLATVAVMRLVDQGRISLDEPVVTYLPAFRMQSPGYTGVTVRMLLDHSSGFPGSDYAGINTGEYWPGYADEVMDSLVRARLKYTPGLYGVYCNDGFTLLEKLIPAVSGRSFPQFMEDEVFAPLGMDHTAYPLAPFADGSYAKAYQGDAERPREVFSALASGGAYSTASDMARLAAMLMNGGAYRGVRVLSSAAVRAMGDDATASTFRPVDEDASRFGLGWDSVSASDLKAVGVTAWMKGGDTSDYHTGVLVAPRAKLAVVVLGMAPLSSQDAEALGQRILLHALVDRGLRRRVPPPLPNVAPPLRRASRAQLSGMLGYWAGATGIFRITVGAGDSQSLDGAMLVNGQWVTISQGLRLRRDGAFHLDGSAGSLSAVTAGGRRYLVSRTIAGSGRSMDDGLLAQRLVSVGELSAAWRARVGHAWLAVNEPATADFYGADAGPVLQVGEVPGTDGYITVATVPYGLQVVSPQESDAAGLMFLQIPGFGSRDMNDLLVRERGGEEWLEYGPILYRPLDGVVALEAGVNAIGIGPEGYAEWRRLPARVQLELHSATPGARWRLYGPDMAVLAGGASFPATAEAPEGSWLAVFGPSGAEINMTAQTGVVGSGAAGAAGAAARIVMPAPRDPLTAPKL